MADDGVVNIAVIGTGTSSNLQPGMAVTGHGQANLAYQVVRPMVAIAIRFAKTYLMSLVALIGLGATTDVLPWHDFATLVTGSYKIALGVALLGLGKDLITVLTDLEKRFPLLFGNI